MVDVSRGLVAGRGAPLTLLAITPVLVTTYPPGSRVPPALEIAQEFGVVNDTAAKAMRTCVKRAGRADAPPVGP